MRLNFKGSTREYQSKEAELVVLTYENKRRIRYPAYRPASWVQLIDELLS